MPDTSTGSGQSQLDKPKEASPNPGIDVNEASSDERVEKPVKVAREKEEGGYKLNKVR